MTVDDAQLRAENQAAEGDVAGWPDVTLRWRTRRGRPTWTGWMYIGILGLLVLLSMLTMLVVRTWAGVLEFAAIDAMLGVLVLGCLLTTPTAFEPETANWALTISSSFIRLDKETPGSPPVSQQIERAEAGNLDIVIQRRAAGKSSYTALGSATGTSLDGATTIQLRGYSIRSGSGLMGLLYRYSVAVVLVSWWPATSLTTPTLQAFVRAGLTFWHPEGAPSRLPLPPLDS